MKRNKIHMYLHLIIENYRLCKQNEREKLN